MRKSKAIRTEFVDYKPAQLRHESRVIDGKMHHTYLVKRRNSIFCQWEEVTASEYKLVYNNRG
jgi:hypothetical protein